ncbi:MAG: flagellar basal body P-ring formation chaperone FlgA [Hyphomicrobiaceae bacterium]
MVKLAISVLMIVLATSRCLAQEAGVVTFPVPATTIQAGDTITGEILIERELIASPTAVRNHMTSRENIIGKVAKRRLAAGMAIPQGALRDPYVFKEGERVTLEFTSGDLSIRGTGIALQPGVVGQPVKVRNADTGIVVTGIVRANGHVALGDG